jgi:hypothetical protein
MNSVSCKTSSSLAFCIGTAQFHGRNSLFQDGRDSDYDTGRTIRVSILRNVQTVWGSY